MPELPEVETTMQGILPHIINQRIANAIIRHPRLRWPIPSVIQTELPGQKVTSLTRRAKYILLTTKVGTLMIHLGMSGHLRILLQETPVTKHDHFDLVFKNNTILRFNDPRRFGAILWIEENPEDHPLLKDLGPEPLTKAFSAKMLHTRLRDKKCSIKSAIMDSKIVTGIGNIYATEALFMAGIHPNVPANSINQDRLTHLVQASKKILRHAIKRGGTTLKNFITSDGKPGYFANELQVYGRTGKPCFVCGTQLKSMRIAQRNTVYCEQCQK